VRTRGDCVIVFAVLAARAARVRTTNIMRPVFTELALFLTPFVAYALFLWATRSGVLDEKAWSRPRLFWLAAVALVLVIASFLVLAEFTGSPPRSTYIPAHMENGQLVPGVEK